MKSRSLLLLGRDYTELGPLAQVWLPEGGALALSRGARPKDYDAVDPNEDAALLVRGERGALLVVADGFHGVAASHGAVELCERAAPALIGVGLADFRLAVERLALGLGQEVRNLGASRTCLVLAAVDAGGCRWACLGDSSLYRSSQPDSVSSPNDLIVRPGLRGLPHPAEYWSGAFRPERGERIAVVSDGVTNFVEDLSTIPRMLASAKSDAEAAREVALAALHGGAGDNVAVVTLALP
jgi:serine/threonine protein phosphatase PrpC